LFTGRTRFLTRLKKLLAEAMLENEVTREALNQRGQVELISRRGPPLRKEGSDPYPREFQIPSFGVSRYRKTLTPMSAR